jgi:hypothetical protein
MKIARCGAESPVGTYQARTAWGAVVSVWPAYDLLY